MQQATRINKTLKQPHRPRLGDGTNIIARRSNEDQTLRAKERVMPILIWIATVACMLEVAGVLPRTQDPRAQEERDPSKDPA